METFKLDSGTEVSTREARRVLLGLEWILGKYGWEALVDFRNICKEKSRKRGLTLTALEADCAYFELMKPSNGHLVPFSDEVRIITLACVRGSGKSTKVKRPRNMPKPE